MLRRKEEEGGTTNFPCQSRGDAQTVVVEAVPKICAAGRLAGLDWPLREIFALNSPYAASKHKRERLAITDRE